MIRALRAFLLADLLVAAFFLATLISWSPGQLYGGPAVTDQLPIQQVIEFAPTTSDPFYRALADSQARYGCTLPDQWRKVYHSAYPVTMIVQPVEAGQPTWHLTAKPWSFKNVGGYVRLLCPKMTAHFTNH